MFQIKVDQMVKQLLQEERDIINIIPKKANIDLKRSIQPKLDKLKKRTEKAIVNILSKKLHSTSNNDEETHQNYPGESEAPIEPVEQYDQEYDYYSD